MQGGSLQAEDEPPARTVKGRTENRTFIAHHRSMGVFGGLWPTAPTGQVDFQALEDFEPRLKAIGPEAERLGSHGNRQTVKVTQAQVVYVAVDAEGRPTPLAP